MLKRKVACLPPRSMEQRTTAYSFFELLTYFSLTFGCISSKNWYSSVEIRSTLHGSIAVIVSPRNDLIKDSFLEIVDNYKDGFIPGHERHDSNYTGGMHSMRPSFFLISIILLIRLRFSLKEARKQNIETRYMIALILTSEIKAE
jgi:hypothetical protein